MPFLPIVKSLVLPIYQASATYTVHTMINDSWCPTYRFQHSVPVPEISNHLVAQAVRRKLLLLSEIMGPCFFAVCCTTFSEIAQIQLLALGENVISFRNCRLGNKFCKLDIIGLFIKKRHSIVWNNTRK